IVMGTKAKIAAAAVLVAIGFLAWQRPWASRSAGVEPTPVAQPGSTAGGESSASLAGHGRSRGAPADFVVGSPQPVPAGPTIRGHVVDRTGHAIAGARVLAIPDTATRFVQAASAAKDGVATE